jgi:hypothetical protein
MERLLIGYALLLLICVWLYPQNDENSDLTSESMPNMTQYELSEETTPVLMSFEMADASAPELMQSQITSEKGQITQLPKSKYPRLQGAYTLTKLVKKDENCTMTINENYESVTGEKIQILAEVEIPAGAVERDTELTLVIDNKTGAASFFPKVKFNKNAKFSLEIYGDSKQEEDVNYYPMTSNMEPIDSKKDKETLAANPAELSGI